MTALRTLLFLSLLAACGGPTPAEHTMARLPRDGVGADVEAVERWVAGTPTYVFGQGYLEEHRVATRPNGPWHAAAIELAESATLLPGHVHRVRLAIRDRSGRPGTAPTVFEILEVLESRPGGPPTAVYPGSSVAGIGLEDVAGFRGGSWGPFRITERGVAFRLREVGPILVGGREIGPGQGLAEVAAVFEQCEASSANAVRCRGAELTEHADEEVSLTIHPTPIGDRS